MAEFSVLSLFSGGGGMDLAFEEEGFEIVGQVENDAYCNAVLEKHWPGVPRWGNIKTLGRRGLDSMGIGSTVAVAVGGPPCQPYSLAGKRRGAADDRHLWPQMRRIVRMLHPRFVLFENVPGIVRMVLDDVLADLESAGYAATPFIVPACAVGATHRRDRVFVVAHAQGDGREKFAEIIGRESAVVSPGAGAGCRTLGGSPAQGVSLDGRTAAGCEKDVDDSQRRGCEGRESTDLGRRQATDAINPSGQDLADAESRGAQAVQQSRSRNGIEQSGRNDVPNADSQPANRASIAWPERGHGDAESRVGRGPAGAARGLDRSRWPAPPGQAQYDWEPPRTTTGVPHRTSRLKVLGNMVVPWQVAPFAKAMRLVLEEERLNG